MQIVLSWNQGISQYQSDFKGLQAEHPRQCPGCGCSRFHKWGKYTRYVVEACEEHRVSIQRILCVKCGKTSSYLPSFCVSGLSYGVDFIMIILKSFIQKLQYSLEERRRRAYALLRRFRDYENLWLVFLRARGFEAFPPNKVARTAKIFTALLKLHRKENILSGFLRETGRHFMSVK